MEVHGDEETVVRSIQSAGFGVAQRMLRANNQGRGNHMRAPERHEVDVRAGDHGQHQGLRCYRPQGEPACSLCSEESLVQCTSPSCLFQAIC